jgi:hypothetical protein
MRQEFRVMVKVEGSEFGLKANGTEEAARGRQPPEQEQGGRAS